MCRRWFIELNEIINWIFTATRIVSKDLRDNSRILWIFKQQKKGVEHAAPAKNDFGWCALKWSSYGEGVGGRNPRCPINSSPEYSEAVRDNSDRLSTSSTTYPEIYQDIFQDTWWIYPESGWMKLYPMKYILNQDEWNISWNISWIRMNEIYPEIYPESGWMKYILKYILNQDEWNISWNISWIRMNEIYPEIYPESEYFKLDYTSVRGRNATKSRKCRG